MLLMICYLLVVHSLDLAKNNLFPQQTVTQLAPENMVWGKSTIFGPL